MPWEQPWRRDSETFASGRCRELLTLSPPQSMGSASVAVDRPRPTFYQVRCSINDGYRSVSHWTHCNPTTTWSTATAGVDLSTRCDQESASM